MRRFFSLILASLMLLCLISSCKEAPSHTDDGTEQASEACIHDTDDEYTDYDGYRYRILTHGSTGGEHWGAYEFFYDKDLVGDLLNEAVARRDGEARALHNIEISYIEKTYGDMSDYAMQSILSGSDDFDLIANSLTGAATLAEEGMLINLRDYDEILDLEGEHWDQRANRDLDIEGHLFFTCSDLTLTDKQATWVIMFTKSMFDRYPDLLPRGYDSIYDMVKKGDWTIDQMYNMVKTVSRDDTDAESTLLDIYGHFGESFSLPSLMFGCGARGFEKDADGKLQCVIARDVETLYDSYAMARDIVLNKEYSMLSGYMVNYVNDVWIDGAGSMMEKGQILFNVTGMNRCHLYRGLEVDFGVIPMPKAKAEQEGYNMNMTGTSNCVAIPISATDKVRSAEILETLTKAASRTTYKAYIDRALQGKYQRDDESEEMLEIIFDSRVFDIGEIFRYENLSFGCSSVFSEQTTLENLTARLNKRQMRGEQALESFMKNMRAVFEKTARR